MSLADQQCIPCRGGVPPLDDDRARELLAELGDGWTLDAEGHLSRDFEFPNFVAEGPILRRGRRQTG